MKISPPHEAISMEKPKIEKLYPALFSLPALVLFAAARLFDLSKYGLWSDEVFSLQTAKLDWAVLFDRVIYDVVHPPLFYVLLKFWIIIGGDSLIWLKLLPVSFALLALIPLNLLCRQLKINAAEYRLTLIFLALNSYQIYFAQELRMYSLLACLSLWSMWLFVRFLKDDSGGKNIEILLFCVNLLLVYTHYFGWFTVLTELVLIFFWQKTKFKRLFIQTFVGGACFLPWSYLVLAAALEKGGLAENLSWLGKPALSDIFLFYAGVQGTLPVPKATSVGFLLFLPPILFLELARCPQKKSDDLLILNTLGLTSVLPVVAAFILSQILTTPVWAERYFVAVATPYALLLAVGVSRISNLRLRKAVLTLAILWTLATGALNVFYYRTRVDWTKISNRIAQIEAAPDARVKVFVLEEWFKLPLQNSLDDIEKGKFDVVKIKNIEDIGEKRFWFGYRQTTWNERESAARKFADGNCAVESEVRDELFNETVYLLFVKCGE